VNVVTQHPKSGRSRARNKSGKTHLIHREEAGVAREPQSSAEQTRAALISAGLKLFGQKGVEATSTREIAAEADANIASIAYHFGGKEGLRLACASHVADQLKIVAGASFLEGPAEPDTAEILSRFEAGLTAMLHFLLLRPEAREVAAFILREVSAPGPAIDVIYRELFGPVHTALCRLWGSVTGAEPESEANKIAVFALIGQVVYFRIGLPLVMRRMGWEEIGESEVEKIRSVLISNLQIIAAAGKEADQ
jgi:AcrR family transcriptional regulator